MASSTFRRSLLLANGVEQLSQCSRRRHRYRHGSPVQDDPRCRAYPRPPSFGRNEQHGSRHKGVAHQSKIPMEILKEVLARVANAGYNRRSENKLFRFSDWSDHEPRVRVPNLSHWRTTATVPRLLRHEERFRVQAGHPRSLGALQGQVGHARGQGESRRS